MEANAVGAQGPWASMPRAESRGSGQASAPSPEAHVDSTQQAKVDSAKTEEPASTLDAYHTSHEESVAAQAVSTPSEDKANAVGAHGPLASMPRAESRGSWQASAPSQEAHGNFTQEEAGHGTQDSGHPTPKAGILDKLVQLAKDKTGLQTGGDLEAAIEKHVKKDALGAIDQVARQVGKNAIKDIFGL